MILALNIYRPPSNNGGIVLYHDAEISPLPTTTILIMLSYYRILSMLTCSGTCHCLPETSFLTLNIA